MHVNSIHTFITNCLMSHLVNLLLYSNRFRVLSHHSLKKVAESCQKTYLKASLASVNKFQHDYTYIICRCGIMYTAEGRDVHVVMCHFMGHCYHIGKSHACIRI